MKSSINFFLTLLTLILVNCTRNNEESTPVSGSSPYSFNYSFNGETSSIKGSIGPNDIPQSFLIPKINASFSDAPGNVYCLLNDVTKKDYVSGIKKDLIIYFDANRTGTGISGTISGVDIFWENPPRYNGAPGVMEVTKLKITDLGTTTTRTASGYNWGKPVRGSYDETVYIWDYKTNKPVAKRLTLDFVAVREF